MAKKAIGTKCYPFLFCLLCFLLFLAISGFAASADKVLSDIPAISAQDLLKPEMLPDAQMGMAVESEHDGAVARVVTTGGEFLIDRTGDSIECRQRISKNRSVGKIKLAKNMLSGLKLVHNSSGSVIYAADNGTKIRINGDSLLMIQPGADGNITAELMFTPDYYAAYKGNYNFFDPDGGISFFEHGKSPESSIKGDVDPVTIVWPWKAGDLLWASVSPPKPYDWNFPSKNRVIRFDETEERFLYPTLNQVASLGTRGPMSANTPILGDILLYDCKEAFKKNRLDLTPKNPAELQKVMDRAHRSNLRFAINAAPLFYFDGNSSPSGLNDGNFESNYLESIKSLIKLYTIDGFFLGDLYQNVGAVAANYHLSRMVRGMIGDTGYLECSGTKGLFGDQSKVYCSTLHAYMSTVRKGDGEKTPMDPGYRRYVLSSYNMSNSNAIANWFDNAPSREQIDTLLRTGVFLHFPEEFIFSGQSDIYFRYYWPRILTPRYGQLGGGTFTYEVMEDLTRKTGIFKQERRLLDGKEGR